MATQKDKSASKRKHWTENVHRNYRFEQELRVLFPIRVTNAQAYEVYAEFHAKRPAYPRYAPEKPEPPKVAYGPIVENEWLRMNVRNFLCKLEHLGILRRIEPGVYVWNRSRPK